MLQYVFVSTLVLLNKTPQEDLVSAPVSQVNMPAFADVESPLQLDIKTEFPSPCYRMGPSSVRVDRDRNVILFHIGAYQTQSTCEAKPTQLTAHIKVGDLREGIYEVRELKNLRKWGEIQVERFETSIRTATEPGLKLAIRKH